jgi:hypothetical protein
VKKLTGGFDNGLAAAIFIGEHSLASFLSKKLPEGISGLFQQYRSKCVMPESSRLGSTTFRIGRHAEPDFSP